MFKPDSKWQWMLLGIVLVELITVLGLEGWALYAFEEGLNYPAIESGNATYLNATNLDIFYQPITDYKPYSRSLPTFLALFIFGMVYLFGLSWDALRLKNTIQIIGIACFNWVLCLYGILQEVQINDAITVLKLVIKPTAQGGADSGSELETNMKNRTYAIPALLGVGSLFISFIGWKLYHEFAWTIYKHVSADLQLRKRYMMFEIYVAILKFDFFFFLSFTMEFLVLLFADRTDYELWLTIIAIPATILILIAAAIIVRRENKAAQWAVLFLYVVGLAYFFFKLIRIWAPSFRRATYAPAAKPLTVLAAFTIAILFLTIAVGYRCLRNFDKGLKPYVNKRSKADQDEDKVYMNDLPNVNHPAIGSQANYANRMTIE